MKTKTIFYLLFSLILLIAFYAMILYKNEDFSMSSKKNISEVRDFAFVSQYGDTITQKDIRNKIVIVNFFFASCDGVCPKMNQALAKIYQQYGSNDKLLILSHTVEPEKDSVQALLKYAQQFSIANKNWLFLTGDKVELYQQARLSYSLDDPNNNVGDIKDQFLHTQFAALVNKDGKVIGIYDLLLPSELLELEEVLKNTLLTD